MTRVVRPLFTVTLVGVAALLLALTPAFAEAKTKRMPTTISLSGTGSDGFAVSGVLTSKTGKCTAGRGIKVLDASGSPLGAAFSAKSAPGGSFSVPLPRGNGTFRLDVAKKQFGKRRKRTICKPARSGPISITSDAPGIVFDTQDQPPSIEVRAVASERCTPGRQFQLRFAADDSALGDPGSRFDLDDSGYAGGQVHAPEGTTIQGDLYAYVFPKAFSDPTAGGGLAILRCLDGISGIRTVDWQW